MKTAKSKRNVNSSFLSNHDLLENFRNKSFKLITRQSSLNDIKPLPKKVSLIQKKSYEDILQDTKQNKQNRQSNKQSNKQNDPMVSNRKKVNVSSKNITQRQKTNNDLDTDVTKIIKELNFVYDQINSEQIQIRMILNKNIRKIKEIFVSKAQNVPQSKIDNTQIEMKYKIEFLHNKIQDQSKKIFKYKKEKQDFIEKIELCQKRILVLQQKVEGQKRKNQQNFDSLNLIRLKEPNNQKVLNHLQNNKNNEYERQQQGQIQILKKIIQSQEQLINKQCLDFKEENYQFYTILQNQALQIEDFIMDKDKVNFSSGKNYSNSQMRVKTNQKSCRGHSPSPRFQHSTYSPFRKDSWATNAKKQRRVHNQVQICLY